MANPNMKALLTTRKPASKSTGTRRVRWLYMTGIEIETRLPLVYTSHVSLYNSKSKFVYVYRSILTDSLLLEK